MHPLCCMEAAAYAVLLHTKQGSCLSQCLCIALGNLHCA